jgi:hypothetical protein
MTVGPRQQDEANEKTVQASTPHLEKLASAAAAAAQARQWRARKNGLQDQGRSRKCETSIITQRPERKLRRPCSR